MGQVLPKLDLSGLQPIDSNEDELEDSDEDEPTPTTDASAPKPVVEKPTIEPAIKDIAEGPAEQVASSTTKPMPEDLN